MTSTGRFEERVRASRERCQQSRKAELKESKDLQARRLRDPYRIIMAAERHCTCSIEARFPVTSITDP